jgi:integrase
MAKLKKNPTKYPGVRYYEHSERKYRGKPDKYFSIRLRIDGKQREEGLGWASEKMTEQKASEILAELKKAKRTGEGPTSLKDKKEIQREIKLIKAKEKAKHQREKITFNKVWDTYFPIQKRNVSVDSWRREDSLNRLWISPIIGNMPMKNVSQINIQKIKKNMEDAGLSARSICYAYDVIRQVYNFANRNNLIDFKSPTLGIKKPKKDNKRDRYLTFEEADLLLNELMKNYQEIYEISLISLHCGLRAGEIFSLKWSDINIKNGMITVRDTKAANRFPLMTNEIKEIFRHKIKGSPNDLVFPSRNDKKRKAISKSFMRTVNKLGLNTGRSDSRDKVVFHTLRHTYASWLVQKGTPIYEVQKLLGHSTIVMTERYSHLAPKNFENSVKIIEKIIRDSKKPKRIKLRSFEKQPAS